MTDSKMDTFRMKEKVDRIKLRSGAGMPLVGLGTWKSPPGEVASAVRHAIKSGYRHIDCAHVYGNEAEIGEAFESLIGTEVTRKDLFVTSKLWNTDHRPEDVEKACLKTLKNLKLEYLDLYLIHWPYAFKKDKNDPDNVFPKTANGGVSYEVDTPLTETWKEMQKLVEKGYCKHIGISNFNKRQIDTIFEMKELTVKPAALQIECHPYLNQEKLIAHARSKGMVITSYSPLGNYSTDLDKPNLLRDPTIKALAEKYKLTPAHILLRFHVQRKCTVIPKSCNPGRIEANIAVDDFAISDDDMEILMKMKQHRFCVPRVKLADGTIVDRDASHPEYPFTDEY